MQCSIYDCPHYSAESLPYLLTFTEFWFGNDALQRRLFLRSTADLLDFTLIVFECPSPSYAYVLIDALNDRLVSTAVVFVFVYSDSNLNHSCLAS